MRKKSTNENKNLVYTKLKLFFKFRNKIIFYFIQKTQEISIRNKYFNNFVKKYSK